MMAKETKKGLAEALKKVQPKIVYGEPGKIRIEIPTCPYEIAISKDFLIVYETVDSKGETISAEEAEQSLITYIKAMGARL